MKSRLLIIILLIANFSCTTSNKTVTDAEKDKIKEEIKIEVNTIIQGCEEADFDMAMQPFLDSTDFVFIFNGVSLSYQGALDGMGPLFDMLENQEITIFDEKFVFLDKSKVIYTANCKFLENYKDGHVTLSEPMVLQCTFVKINDSWKVINGVESSVRRDFENAESLKELNQI